MWPPCLKWGTDFCSFVPLGRNARRSQEHFSEAASDSNGRRIVPILLTLKKFSCPVSLVTNGFYLHVFVFLKKDFWDWSPMQNSRFYFPCSVSVGDWGYVHASKHRRAVRSTGLWSETGGASDDPTSKLRNFLWFYLWVALLWSSNSHYGFNMLDIPPGWQPLI